ncbi:MAG TPA: ABC transporter permease [Opitutaceae bacterium]|nr:ABC transporter permease [Opitutaceae bacterium]
MSARGSPGFLAHLNPIAPLRQFFVQRELLWQFTLRNFGLKHKGSYLGLGWAVLNPLLMLGLYFVVFGKIFVNHFGVPNETSVDVALALLVGLTVFHFLSEVICQSPAVIVGNPNLVKKVVFPLEVLPLANLGACFFNFAISLALVVLGQVVFGRGLPASIVWLPAIVVPIVLLSAGFAWFLAALGVFFRDLTQLTQFASILLMYVSAVFFSSARIREHPDLWAVLRFNPVLHSIDLLRDALLWNHPINLGHLGWLYLGSAVICLLGYASFAALRSSFADVL